jgi:hypothetical protein
MPPSPREAPSTVHVCSPPSRPRRTAFRPPGERSSETDSPAAVSIVTPASPGAFWSVGSSWILTSCRRPRAWPISLRPDGASDSGFHPSRDDSQPQNSNAAASESWRWRTVTDETLPSAARSCGGSNDAATRSRHGVERSHARSTT